MSFEFLISKIQKNNFKATNVQFIGKNKSIIIDNSSTISHDFSNCVFKDFSGSPYSIIDISTTILDAQIFSKPVISISVKNYDWGLPPIFESNSCI